MLSTITGNKNPVVVAFRAIKNQIDRYLGMCSTIDTEKDPMEHWIIELQYLSPSGRRIFGIEVYCIRGMWKVGGCRDYLHEQWAALCGMSQKIEG